MFEKRKARPCPNNFRTVQHQNFAITNSTVHWSNDACLRYHHLDQISDRLLNFQDLEGEICSKVSVEGTYSDFLAGRRVSDY